MTSAAMALTPVPARTGTGAGATTGATRQPGHCQHTLCEDTDGRQEGLEGGRFMARHGPGAAPSPLLPGPGSRTGPVRDRV
jgi:hypothetical protein